MRNLTFSAAAQKVLNATCARLIKGVNADAWLEFFFSGEPYRGLSEIWPKLLIEESDLARAALHLPPGSGAACSLAFYDGQRPRSPDDPVTTQRLLARLQIDPATLCAEPST